MEGDEKGPPTAEQRYHLRGDVDVAIAPRLLSDLLALVASSSDDLVVDCSDLTFIDAAGIRVLVDVHRAVDRRGGRFSVVHLHPSYLRIFDLLDLTDPLDVRGTSHG